MIVESAQRFTIHTVTAEGREPREDRLVVEAPMQIRVDGTPLAVIMRTPGHDLELGAGFLLSESILESPGDLGALSHCPEPEAEDNVVEVHLHPSVSRARRERLAERATTVSASCGVCGRRTLESVASRAPAFERSPPAYGFEFVCGLPDRLAEAQVVFRATGGLHGAGIFRADGEALVVREDVGRHNAVDKCIGSLFLAEAWPLSECILVVSGRASFEIVEKALIARIQTVVSVSAPSSLAVELARASNMNLYAFVRKGRLNVYSGGLAPYPVDER